MKAFNIIKTIIFFIAGILVLVFHNFLTGEIAKNLNLFVGLIIVLFSIEPIVLIFIKSHKDEFLVNTLKGSITLCLGLLMIFLIENISSELLLACIIWGVWSLLREIEEIRFNVCCKFKSTPITSVINILESIALIVLVIIFMINHMVRGVNIHLYILGIELLLEAIWPFVYKLELYLRKNK